MKHVQFAVFPWIHCAISDANTVTDICGTHNFSDKHLMSKQLKSQICTQHNNFYDVHKGRL